jgi:hypothetical protein
MGKSLSFFGLATYNLQRTGRDIQRLKRTGNPVGFDNSRGFNLSTPLVPPYGPANGMRRKPIEPIF